jgi:hypothetical protein
MKDLNTFSFELPNEVAARARAQEIADRSGKEVVVTNAVGHELLRVQPVRRNELMIVNADRASARAPARRPFPGLG